MEYKGVRYTIRTGIERERWSVAIHPAGVEMPGKVISGRRDAAEKMARCLIDKWLERHPREALRVYLPG
jgi:hypothetical protein